MPNDKQPIFLIITGALTALGLPFAIAYPRTVLDKTLAVALLIAVAAAVAAAIEAFLRRRSK